MLSFDALSLDENGLDMRHFDRFSFSAGVMFAKLEIGCDELAVGWPLKPPVICSSSCRSRLLRF